MLKVLLTGQLNTNDQESARFNMFKSLTDSNSDKTIGATIKKYNITETTDNSKSITSLSVWDISQNLRYRTLQVHFYKEADIIINVLDAPTGPTNAIEQPGEAHQRVIAPELYGKTNQAMVIDVVIDSNLKELKQLQTEASESYNTADKDYKDALLENTATAEQKEELKQKKDEAAESCKKLEVTEKDFLKSDRQFVDKLPTDVIPPNFVIIASSVDDAKAQLDAKLPGLIRAHKAQQQVTLATKSATKASSSTRFSLWRFIKSLFSGLKRLIFKNPLKGSRTSSSFSAKKTEPLSSDNGPHKEIFKPAASRELQSPSGKTVSDYKRPSNDSSNDAKEDNQYTI